MLFFSPFLLLLSKHVVHKYIASLWTPSFPDWNLPTGWLIVSSSSSSSICLKRDALRCEKLRCHFHIWRFRWQYIRSTEVTVWISSIELNSSTTGQKRRVKFTSKWKQNHSREKRKKGEPGVGYSHSQTLWHALMVFLEFTWKETNSSPKLKNKNKVINNKQ